MAGSILDALQNVLDGWRAPRGKRDLPPDVPVSAAARLFPLHFAKAGCIFPKLIPLLQQAVRTGDPPRAVVSLYGGSGCGKTGTAILLGTYLRQAGVGCCVLHGDDYPRRIPEQNDAERLRVYRSGGIRGLLAGNMYTKERAAKLQELQRKGLDPEPAQAAAEPWLTRYQQAAANALAEYLGGRSEQDFEQLNRVIANFKQGAPHLWLRRLGRTADGLRYEKADVSDACVLLLEWTHGNSPYLQGVDIPIFLESTPDGTREGRRRRNRDAGVDDPFTAVVLSLEQKQLDAQADRARIIVSREGENLTPEQYRRLLAKREGLSE